jgi:hypothetical protein
MKMKKGKISKVARRSTSKSTEGKRQNKSY